MATTSPDPSSTKPQGQGLEGGVLTLKNCLALSAAVMAPVLAVILNAPAAGASAGKALPVAFLLAFVAALFVGNTVIEFAKKLPSAGSFYTFCSRSLGSRAGFFTGWLYFAAFVLLTVGLFTANGAFLHDYLKSTFDIDVPFLILSVIIIAVAMTLSIRSIRTSVRLDLILLGLEMFIFALLALICIVRAGDGNSLTYFDPSATPTGFSGLGLGVVFGLLSFVGFEAAATLGEETGDARRNVPLAVGGSLIGVGVFFVFVLYGLAAGFHLNSAEGLQSFLDSPAAFSSLAETYAPWLKQPVELAAVAGLFSCLLAVLNTTVRVVYAMAREGVLPTGLARIHPRFRSPDVAIYALVAFSVVVGFILSAWIGTSLTDVYGFTGSLGTVAIVLVYILANVGLTVFYRTRPEFSPVRHLVLPALGTLFLLYPLYQIAKPGQSFPYNLVPYGVLAWVVLGFLVYAYLQRTAPEKITALGAAVATDDSDFDEDRARSGEAPHRSTGPQ